MCSGNSVIGCCSYSFVVPPPRAATLVAVPASSALPPLVRLELEPHAFVFLALLDVYGAAPPVVVPAVVLVLLQLVAAVLSLAFAIAMLVLVVAPALRLLGVPVVSFRPPALCVACFLPPATEWSLQKTVIPI